jgi:hypothetical protein
LLLQLAVAATEIVCHRHLSSSTSYDRSLSSCMPACLSVCQNNKHPMSCACGK